MSEQTENLLSNEVVRAQAAGFAIDASILDEQRMLEAVREDVRLNCIEYVFPEGVNQVDMFEECRALTRLGDFETMYDLTMQMLHGKPVVIFLKNEDGSKGQLCAFQITDRYMDLRSVAALDAYPYLITWLTEFMGACLSKKFPLPGIGQSQAQAAVKKTKSGKREKQPKPKAVKETLS